MFKVIKSLETWFVFNWRFSPEEMDDKITVFHESHTEILFYSNNNNKKKSLKVSVAVEHYLVFLLFDYVVK